nr:GPI anchored protein [Aspergillus niger CBS 513.88]|eukprot:XP_001399150.2 GPI anchored protein [Aspergillus niger CBS 513.88]
MMNRTLLLGLAAAGLVSAKATVTSMFIYDTDPQPLAASIIGNDATATTYSINCPPGTDSSDCGMGPGLTLIAGPKTTMILDAPDLDFYYTCVCSVDGTTHAVCTETASGSGANFPGTSSSTLDGDLDLMPVTITAGSSQASAASTSAATAGSVASSKTATASNVNASATGTGKASLAKSDAGLVFGGAAAAAFIAAVL